MRVKKFESKKVQEVRKLLKKLEDTIILSCKYKDEKDNELVKRLKDEKKDLIDSILEFVKEDEVIKNE